MKKLLSVLMVLAMLVGFGAVAAYADDVIEPQGMFDGLEAAGNYAAEVIKIEAEVAKWVLEVMKPGVPEDQKDKFAEKFKAMKADAEKYDDAAKAALKESPINYEKALQQVKKKNAAEVEFYVMQFTVKAPKALTDLVGNGFMAGLKLVVSGFLRYICFGFLWMLKLNTATA